MDYVVQAAGVIDAYKRQVDIDVIFGGAIRLAETFALIGQALEAEVSQTD